MHGRVIHQHTPDPHRPSKFNPVTQQLIWAPPPCAGRGGDAASPTCKVIQRREAQRNIQDSSYGFLKPSVRCMTTRSSPWAGCWPCGLSEPPLPSRPQSRNPSLWPSMRVIAHHPPELTSADCCCGDRSHITFITVADRPRHMTAHRGHFQAGISGFVLNL